MPVKNRNRSTNSGYDGELVGLSDNERSIIESAILKVMKKVDTDQGKYASIAKNNVGTYISSYIEGRKAAGTFKETAECFADCLNELVASSYFVGGEDTLSAMDDNYPFGLDAKTMVDIRTLTDTKGKYITNTGTYDTAITLPLNTDFSEDNFKKKLYEVYIDLMLDNSNYMYDFKVARLNALIGSNPSANAQIVGDSASWDTATAESFATMLKTTMVTGNKRVTGYNVDGSEAEACNNYTLYVAKYVTTMIETNTIVDLLNVNNLGINITVKYIDAFSNSNIVAFLTDDYAIKVAQEKTISMEVNSGSYRIAFNNDVMSTTSQVAFIHAFTKA